MALVFGANTSDRIQYTIGASTQDFGPLSIWAWVMPTTLSTRGIFQQKATVGGARTLTIRSTGQVDSSLAMSTTNADARSTNSAPYLFTVNVWWFVAATWDASFVPRLYLGNLTTTVYECTYATQITGVGTPVTDAGGPALVGNRDASPALAFQGSIAYVGYDNVALSLAALKSLQFNPRKLASTKMFYHVGINGTGTQPDWSGSGNAGTITGATVGAHVPLGPQFGLDTYGRYFNTVDKIGYQLSYHR